MQNKITVQSVTLAEWAESELAIPSIDVIWMDLQGAELRALRGLGELISDGASSSTPKSSISRYTWISRWRPMCVPTWPPMALSERGRFNVSAYSGDELFCQPEQLAASANGVR